MSSAPHALVEREGHVLVVTLNRPEARNAFSAEMLVRMGDAWALLDSDPELRVAILTGGKECFCAGADLKAFAGGQEQNEWTRRFQEDADLQWKALLRHRRPRKPIVAAVEGPAIAGGTEILQGTDVRVAGASARFGVSEVRWGLFPLGGSTVRLRRQIPYTVAAEILLTGRHLSAEEAREVGLVGRVVPDGEALPEAAALQRELEIGLPIFATEDAREGPRAFKEKRKPAFKGR